MSQQTFLSRLQDHFEQVDKRNALKIWREKSWQKLSEMGLPTKSHEAFRYVSLRELYLLSFKRSEEKQVDKTLISDAILPECAHSHIVFIDGRFSAEHSDITALPQQTVLLSLEDALRSHSHFLQGHFSRTLKEEKDPFAFTNLALHAKGAFFYLPPKLETSIPLQCLHIATREEPEVVAPRLHLVLGSQSRMRCILTTKDNASHLMISTTQISLEDGACLDILNVADAAPAWHFETMRATLKKNARLNSLSVTFGGKVFRQSYRVQLIGENSEANLSGLWMLSDNRCAHTHAIVEHEAPHTRSMQHFKGILDGHSQSSFEGKILVRPEAQKTEAYQLNNNLLLGQGAIANTKPNLEVFADDVKASHGATVSHLDEQQLFYLKARGIDLNSARRLLIGGFCREMIGKIPYDSLLRRLNLNIDAFGGI